MAAARQAPNEEELERLREIFLKAETGIINEIGRLRSAGNVDYHAVAALERVQRILYSLENDCWEYVPKMVEKQFYVRAPKARRIAGETVEKHIAGYKNAAVLTADQYAVVDKLVQNLMGEITAANATVISTLQSALIGRPEADFYRQAGIEATAAMEAAGKGVYKALPEFIQALRREGVTAFVDKAGRHWSLHAYGSMVCRTTSRQAEVLAVLTADPEQDLYKISSHGTTCPICAPLEGRVYSRSGADPDFPPLAAAFGKIDPNGPDDLANTYLNIHPNCLHVLLPWTPAGRSKEEVEEAKRFSSFKANPPTIDPRTKAQVDAYRRKEKARAKWLRDYRQWEQYRMILGNKVPKTFGVFQKHKLADDEKYQEWMDLYRNRDRLLTNAGGKTIIEVEHVSLRRRPNSITQVVRARGGIDRNYYGPDGYQVKQISNNGHGNSVEEALGKHGEHTHDYVYDSNGKLTGRPSRELNEQERKENADFL
jgi:hypothetical protein